MSENGCEFVAQWNWRERPVAPCESDLAMARYADGDDAAFSVVYQNLKPRLERYFLAQSRDRARAEDHVQQTFLRMMQARRQFAPGRPVLPWALAIARRLSIDGFRVHGREALGLAHELEHLPSRHCADGQLHARQLGRILERELNRIPPSHRQAFELVHAHGRSLAEAAGLLGVTTMTVKMRSHRARKALRTALERHAA
jgi:RNA polymerase sigma-70 factor (ECF subfamily)